MRHMRILYGFSFDLCAYIHQIHTYINRQTTALNANNNHVDFVGTCVANKKNIRAFIGRIICEYLYKVRTKGVDIRASMHANPTLIANAGQTTPVMWSPVPEHKCAQRFGFEEISVN